MSQKQGKMKHVHKKTAEQNLTSFMILTLLSCQALCETNFRKTGVTTVATPVEFEAGFFEGRIGKAVCIATSTNALKATQKFLLRRKPKRTGVCDGIMGTLTLHITISQASFTSVITELRKCAPEDADLIIEKWNTIDSFQKRKRLHLWVLKDLTTVKDVQFKNKCPQGFGYVDQLSYDTRKR
jgi:hypothetical protein